MVMVKPALAYLDVIAAVRGRRRRAARRVPRVGRVLDDQGGRGATAGSTATPSRSSTSPRSSGPAPTSSSPTSRPSSPRCSRRDRLLRRRPLSGGRLRAGAVPRTRPRRQRGAVRARVARHPRRRELARPGVSAVGGTPYFVARGRRAVRRGTSRATATSTSCRATAPSSSATPTRPWSPRSRPRRPTARPTARPPRARCSWPRRSRSACRSCEQVRLVNSGTEATMTAVRVARGFTGRAESSSSPATTTATPTRCSPRAAAASPSLGLSGSAGVTDARGGRTRWSRPTTCVPDARRPTWPASSSSRSPPTWASSRPAPGFLEGLRAECDRVGRPARSSTRSSPASASASAARRRASTCAPDLTCFGKVIGGGLPIAAFGGRRRRHGGASRPLGPVYQAGTLSGNPLATAAGLTVAVDFSTTLSYERWRHGRAVGATACGKPSPAPASRSPCP